MHRDRTPYIINKKAKEEGLVLFPIVKLLEADPEGYSQGTRKTIFSISRSRVIFHL